MTQAIAWHFVQQYGCLGNHTLAQVGEVAEISAAMLAACAGQPIKYYARLTPDARVAMHVVGLAVRAAGWPASVLRETGLLCAGYQGWVRACATYYMDYVIHDRAIGRANLFIYTLPTSVASETAIALRLGGPTCHLHGAANPVEFLLEQAEQMVTDGQAPAMLALWAQTEAALCLAIGPGTGRLLLPLEQLRKDPHELVAWLCATAGSECQPR